MITKRIFGWILIALFILIFSTVAFARGAHPILISGKKAGNCYYPLWSRDGKKLAYEVNYLKTRLIELYMINFFPEIKEIKVELDEYSADQLLKEFDKNQGKVRYELSWSPPLLDRYIFSSNELGDNYNLFISKVGAITKDKHADGQPFWSPDGKKIVFVSGRSGNGDLYLLNTFNLEKGVRRLTFSDNKSELFPVFSPDSKQVAFMVHSNQGDNIYLLPDLLKPKNVKRLTFSNSTYTNPSWSPDGKRIAFFSRKSKTNTQEIVIYNLASGKSYPVARGVVNSERRGPSWGPNGKKIFYIAKSKEFNNPIKVVDIKSGKNSLISTDTLLNADLDLVQDPQKNVILAFTAQGRKGDKNKRWRKVYIFPVNRNILK